MIAIYVFFAAVTVWLIGLGISSWKDGEEAREQLKQILEEKKNDYKPVL
jgi:flavodoxin